METFERGWLSQIAAECAANGDGSFLSARCGALRDKSVLYYTRLESDRAVALSIGALWHRLLTKEHEPERHNSRGDSGRRAFTWHDEYHGAVVHRSGTRFASVVWRAAEPPTTLCLPPDASNMAEWRQCLSGVIEGEGYVNWHAPDVFSVAEYEGFISAGRTCIHSHGFVPEGTAPQQELAVQDLLFAALPDSASTVVLQHTRVAQRRVYLTRYGSLFLPVPNDIFNGCTRRYETQQGSMTLAGVQSIEEVLDLRSRWVTLTSVCACAA